MLTIMNLPNRPIVLHRFALSGHSHRAELLLSLLGLPYELAEVDLRAKAQKAPGFLAKNPFGQVPVMEDGSVTIADSSAILVYLADRYDETSRWLPRDSEARARVQQWLSVAAGELAQGPAVARRIKVFGAPLDHERASSIAHDLFAVMERHLATHQFFVGDAATIADIAMYTYTAHAPEGGVDLEPYKQIRTWLKRIEALPGFVPMKPAGG